ncbi:DUF1294 domain-containing protein [Ruegeria atlantica]|uniref:DUF1294 domain-containing protein n=1 Tax=Ruegeria atlantica TaxID=81569 RepID=UPI0034A080B6
MKFSLRFSRCADSVKKPRYFSLGPTTLFGYPSTMWIAVIYLWTINALTLLAFGWDKLQARRRKKRAPERNLLWLAALGGSPGALLGRWIFRHKTRKRLFSYYIFGIFGAQAVLAYLLTAIELPSLA